MMRVASHYRSRQFGLNLVELMIALVIGLAILAGLSQVFVAGQQSYSLQDRMGALQENGRYALFFLQRDIRNAGLPKGEFDSYDPSDAAAPEPFQRARTLDGGGNASDQISMMYRAAANGTNCLGNNIIAGEMVATTYSINLDAATGVSRLMCSATSGGAAGAQATGAFAAAQPIVDGIENMQILYGVDANNDGFADSYVPASAGLNRRNVVAVRVAVLASSMTPIVGDTATDNARTFVLLNAPPVGPLQKNFPAPAGPMIGIRGRVFTTTVEVRNRTTL